MFLLLFTSLIFFFLYMITLNKYIRTKLETGFLSPTQPFKPTEGTFCSFLEEKDKISLIFLAKDKEGQWKIERPSRRDFLCQFYAKISLGKDPDAGKD